jgi:hypothetical protein
MQLREALNQISDIRQQMARSELFRGYRALTVGGSGMLALAAAAVQPHVVRPETLVRDFLSLWLAVAAVCVSMAGIQLWRRARCSGSQLAREATLLAAEQFAPCLLVGAVLTFCIARYADQAAWMLPGLWSLTYSLGIFASYRLLPRMTAVVAAYYVAAGAACLAAGQGAQAFAPWQMAVCFGGGQLLGAGVLYWTLERTNGPTA